MQSAFLKDAILKLLLRKVVWLEKNMLWLFFFIGEVGENLSRL